MPANTLSCSLGAGAPVGASITAAGVFTWTPTEAQGPGSYPVTVIVTDDGTPALNDSETITVTVNEVNQAPVLNAIGDKLVDELALLTFTAAATDADLPANTLSFSLGAGAPAGASITAAGVFTWTPTEAQGPGSYPVTVIVTDNGTPALSDSELITITVNEVNQAPVLNTVSNVVVDEGLQVNFNASATDGDVPANSLLFSLVGASHGATINPLTGAFQWSAVEGPDVKTFTIRVTDNGSPSLFDEQAFTVTVNNVAPSNVNLLQSASVIDEGNGVALSGSFSDPGVLDAHTVTISWGDGTPNSVLSLAAGNLNISASHLYADDNPTSTPLDTNAISVVVTDDDGASGSAFGSVTVNNVAPNITSVVGPLVPQPLGSASTVTVNFTDPGSPDVHKCSFSWDDGTADQVVNVSPVGTRTCSATRTFTSPGVYTVGVKVNDDDGGEDTDKFEFVVIYDPSTGFVTGGGFIMSPIGACKLATCTDDTVGKAHFGFVSKYKKGASTPDGQTEFQFQAGDLNFHSSAYDVGSLVVASYKAQYKGTGTINGVSGYRFVLTAYDGNVQGGGGVDRFRMKITKDGLTVYDNKMGISDDIDNVPMAISGGSIVIHK